MSKKGKLLCDIFYYAIIVLFVSITIMASICCTLLLFPKVGLGEYANFITAIVALFAFIVAWMEYNSRKDTLKAQVFSEYNKRFSEDPNIIKVTKYLNYIDGKGTENNPPQEMPSNYEVEMFMRFFEELELQIQYGRLDEEEIMDLFIFYAKKIDEKEDLRTILGINDYPRHWKTYKLLMNRKKQ